MIWRPLIGLALLVIDSASASVRAEAGTLNVAPEWAKPVANCRKAESGKPHVWLFKQWHLDPSLDTHDRAKAKLLPQAANQTAIYRQLDQWVGAGSVPWVIAEGCAGELNAESKTRFNGWTVQDLKPESSKPHYDDEIVASVAEKIEAKYGEKVRVLCGDDNALTREHLLAFSDIRGTLGFLTRLTQYKDQPARAKTYLEGVIELYRLPADTTIAQALARLRNAMKDAAARLDVALEKRNRKVMEVIQAAGASGNIAVVYGGVHAAGLQKLMEDKGLGCTVLEPVGYQNDESALLERLKTLLKEL